MELSLSRGVTGIGIGVMVPLITAMAAEFSNDRHRGLAVSFTTVGQPLGGIVGGLTAATLLRRHSWTLFFWWSGVATALLIPVVSLSLPEIDRVPHQSAAASCAGAAEPSAGPLSPADGVAAPPEREAGRTSYRALFAPGWR